MLSSLYTSSAKIAFLVPFWGLLTNSNLEAWNPCYLLACYLLFPTASGLLIFL